MTGFQIALLILAIASIAIVGFISYRRSEARDEPADDAPRDTTQLKLWEMEGAAGGFDEFGVSEPRPRGRRAEPQVDVERVLPERSRERQIPLIDLPPPPAPIEAEALRTADAGATGQAPRDAANAGAQAQHITALFVARSVEDPMQGVDIHRALHQLALEPGIGHSYQRSVDGQPWFHIASMVKPGYLDPSEADTFATPGLSLFLVLPGPSQPLDAFDDMLATAVRLAGRLGGRVLDARQRPLSEAAAQALRGEVVAWLQRDA